MEGAEPPTPQELQRRGGASVAPTSTRVRSRHMKPERIVRSIVHRMAPTRGDPLRYAIPEPRPEHAAALEQSGWRVLTIWECELRDLDRIMSGVYEFLGP